MEKVCIGSCREYEVRAIRELVEKGFEETGFEVRDAKVLIKPNLLGAKAPEKAVTTHPAVVRALAELLKDRGCSVHVGDSPGYESTERVLRVSGILAVMEEMGLRLARFDGRVTKRWNGVSPYKVFTLGEDPGSYDMVINVPKLKSHIMMGLTLGVKNTFGFIPSREKARWHLRAGRDRACFASVLVDIHNIVKPALTVLDGITGMDGDGPSSGRPRPFGILGVSRSAFALDRAIEKLVGLTSPLPVSEVALKNGLGCDYELCGPGAARIKGFIMARQSDADWSIPGFVRKILRSCFTDKPRVRKKACKACGICARVCPAGAVVVAENVLPVFDYGTCIRCYCCQEMCPEGAIKV